VVLTQPDGTVLRELSEYLGTQTNNYAEYQALLRGLRAARALGADVVHCFLDSQLVVRQLNGQYRVKHAQIRPLYEEVRQAASAFDQVTFAHLPRAENFAADALANQALDEAVARRMPR